MGDLEGREGKGLGGGFFIIEFERLVGSGFWEGAGPGKGEK